MKLEKATIHVMDTSTQYSPRYVEVSKDFDDDMQEPRIVLAPVSVNMRNRSFPDMTIADATELRDALTILIGEKEEA